MAEKEPKPSTSGFSQNVKDELKGPDHSDGETESPSNGEKDVLKEAETYIIVDEIQKLIKKLPAASQLKLIGKLAEAEHGSEHSENQASHSAAGNFLTHLSLQSIYVLRHLAYHYFQVNAMEKVKCLITYGSMMLFVFRQTKLVQVQLSYRQLGGLLEVWLQRSC